jgi:hypothetical protein
VFRRRCCILIADVHLTDLPGAGWQHGPPPLRVAMAGMPERASRSTYFHDRVARALYDGDRFHRMLEPRERDVPGVSTFEPELVELLRFRTGKPNALLAIHGRLTADGAEIVDDLWELGQARLRPWPLAEWCDGVLLDGFGRHVPSNAFVTSIVYVTPSDGPLDGVLARVDRGLWTPSDQWLWLLASRLGEDRYAPTAADHAQARASTIELSLDWSAMVRRTGVAFLGLRADAGDSDIPFRAGEVFVRSTYLDVILLGLVQRQYLAAFADAMARLGDPIDNPHRLRRLEAQFRRFRNVYWWPQVSAQEYGNRLLELFSERSAIGLQFDQVVDELATYSGQVQTAAAERTNALVALATIPVLPFAVAIGLVQALGVRRTSMVGLALLAALAVCLVVLVTPPGRRSVESLLPQRGGADDADGCE